MTVERAVPRDNQDEAKTTVSSLANRDTKPTIFESSILNRAAPTIRKAKLRYGDFGEQPVSVSIESVREAQSLKAAAVNFDIFGARLALDRSVQQPTGQKRRRELSDPANYNVWPPP